MEPEHRAAGLAAVDVALPSARVAVELDGPSHFFANAPSVPVGGTAFKRRLLRALGWQLVSVPHFHWAQLATGAARAAYVALALAGSLAALPDEDVRAALAGLGPPRARAGALAVEIARMLAEYSASDAGGHDRGDQVARLVAELEGEEEAVAEGGEGVEAEQSVVATSPPPSPPPPPPPDPNAIATRVIRLAAVRGRQGRLTASAALAAGRRAAQGKRDDGDDDDDESAGE